MLRSVRLRDVQVGLRFCPALGLLASWGVDDFNHEILIWDLDELKVVHVLNDGHSEPVKDVCEVALPLHQNAQDPNERAWEPLIGTKYYECPNACWPSTSCTLVYTCPDKAVEADAFALYVVNQVHSILVVSRIDGDSWLPSPCSSGCYVSCMELFCTKISYGLAFSVDSTFFSNRWNGWEGRYVGSTTRSLRASPGAKEGKTSSDFDTVRAVAY